MNAPAQLDFGFPRPTPLQPEPKMAKKEQSTDAPSRRSYCRTETEAREWPRTPRFLSWQSEYAYNVCVPRSGPI